MGTATLARPRFATPRTPERFTYGPAVADVARKLGWELMPHQCRVLDVGLEIDPDTGTFAYRDITATEPRQGGKSSRMLALLIWRCTEYAALIERNQVAVYSAQSGSDARAKVLRDWVPRIEDEGVNVSRVYKGDGNVHLVFGRSRIEVASNSPGAAHGRTIDIGVIDEAFDDIDERREQAFIPAMATRADAQLWVCSTMGTEEAVYLNRKVEIGRAAAERGDTKGTAYFEWSARDLDEAHNPEAWATFMPALERTINRPAIEHAQRSMTEPEFARAFGNVWTPTVDNVIPYDAWEACLLDEAAPEGGLHLAIDAPPDRSSAVIVAASRDGMAVEVIDKQPGLSWAVDRLTELRHAHDVRSIVVHGGGPAGTLIGALERSGAELYIATDTEMMHAAGTFYDHVIERTLRVRPSVVLNEAVQGARRRQRGDAFTWSRRSPSTDLSPLVAASLAVWRAHNDEGGALWLFG